MRFKEIIGNEKVKENLIKSVKNNRLAHSHLFLGSTGSSKLALAIAFAQYINCTDKIEEDSCGKCDSCVKYNQLIHPDLHLIFPVLSIRKIKKPISDNFVLDFRREVLKNPYLNLNNWFEYFSEDNKTGKTGKIYVQESENLQKKLTLKHYESEFRIIIIWMPETMQLYTSNKLLKLLEEPPRKTIFLLVSERADLLLKTILSRLQITNIKQHSYFENKNILTKKYNKKEDEIERIINYKNGDISESIGTIESENLEEFQKWMRISYTGNIKEITKWANERSNQGRMSQSSFLKYSLKLIRDCIHMHFSNNKLLKSTQKEKEFLLKFHSFIHEQNVLDITTKIEQAIQNIERNANVKITFYELSLQFIQLLKVKRKFANIN